MSMPPASTAMVTLLECGKMRGGVDAAGKT
jgi:hypothetical protein